MNGFGHLQLCSELTEEDANAACESRESFEALLWRLAEISAPNTGGGTIFIAFGRLASMACDWVDGDLAIELLDVEDSTEVRMMTELGAGMREVLFAPFRLRVSLKELTSVLDTSPSLVGALRVHRRSWKRVTLDVAENVRRWTSPPRISERSLIAVRPPSVNAGQTTARAEGRDSSNEIDASWDDSED